jgi:hypothetical protein
VRKSTAATSEVISMTMGRTPSCRRPSSSPTQIDAEPSVSGEEFPVVIDGALRATIEAAARSHSGRCCVLFVPFDKADYLKTDSRG